MLILKYGFTHFLKMCRINSSIHAEWSEIQFAVVHRVFITKKTEKAKRGGKAAIWPILCSLYKSGIYSSILHVPIDIVFL